MLHIEDDSYTIGHIQRDNDHCVVYLDGEGNQTLSREEVDGNVWLDLVKAESGSKIEVVKGKVVAVRT